ncbi:MAG: hypothetical protein AB8B61_02480 [Cyclobacteriaceae bacterium]
MRKNILTLLSVALLGTAGYAENPLAVKNTEETQGLILDKRSFGVHAGIKGFGGDLGIKIIPMIHASVGFSILKFNENSKIYKKFVDDEGIENAKAELNLGSIDFKGEFYPFPVGSSFKLAAGMSYFLQEQQLTASGTIDGNSSFLGSDLVPNVLGVSESFSAEVEFSRLVPYFGIGLGRIVPKKKIGFGIDIGAYLIGDGKVTVDAENFQQSEEEAREQMQKEVDKLPPFLPSLTFRVMVNL